MALPVRASRDAIAQINVTPLVDVLLVLLIIFMITAPVVTRRLKIDLPQPGPQPHLPRPAPIQLAIHSDGSMYWNAVPVDRSAVNVQLALAALQAKPPALHIDAADGTPYQAVADVLSSAKSNGLADISFVGR
ncbi:biopolymer transporter ExbD [Rhodanobacter denitrificans]|uniref:Biopolymer transporter ExbD n=1 Tax=Rhodanobacter denitrificans TaxID=666685 RepID=A0A368KD78_9GAMM|nr:biopolymer transporter ExbD [Rhodanobacter denitrificans]RCS29881.1 biopolymer transporter ExbD [Rhodanobacter denitrificans]